MTTAMKQSAFPTGRVRLFARLLLAGALAAILLVPGTLAGAQQTGTTFQRDYPVPGGWFYSQESRDPKDRPPFRGYTVTDDAEGAFWTEFRRYGGIEILGYPVSRRYHYPDPRFGFVHQAFQRGILQWRPEQGRAEIANVFEMFTEQGLDDALETVGIPKPRPGSQLSFAEDAERRMGWLTEPRFMARYFFDPINQTPFDSVESAWALFGLPQQFPDRPVYLRERANGKFGAPLYLPYVVQRYQKASLQLFLDTVANDPTIVPGDGKAGCVAISASGRLARRLGAGKIIPGLATQPEPAENPPKVHFVAFVPPLGSGTQRVTQFEMIGTGFDPGEQVTLQFTPVSSGAAATTSSGFPFTFIVDQTDADGSFDVVITARVGQYTVSMLGNRSGKTLDILQDPLVDLSQPNQNDADVASKATYC